MRSRLQFLASAILLVSLLAWARLTIWMRRLFRRSVAGDAREVTSYLHALAADVDELWGWHEFVSVPIADEHLDSIRKRAARIRVPLTDADHRLVAALIDEVEQCADVARPTGA
jgi:hypothetical protein